MKLSVISSTRIKVTWGRPNCQDQNGDITGYSLRYEEEGSGEEDRMVKVVSSAVATIITGLTKETVYTFEVAAVTSAGIGVYSQPQTIETPDSESFLFTSVYVLCFKHRCLLQSK